MIKNAYYNGIAKKAIKDITIVPGILDKVLRGITSSSKGSKITRALLAGVPVAAIAKLVGAGWGTSAAIGAGAGTAAWFAPKLSEKYRFEQRARDKGVPAQVLDAVHYLDTDRYGENPLDELRAIIVKDPAGAIAKSRDAFARLQEGKTDLLQSLMLGQQSRFYTANEVKRNRLRRTRPVSNTRRLLSQLIALQAQDILLPQDTGRTAALTDLIKHK